MSLFNDFPINIDLTIIYIITSDIVRHRQTSCIFLNSTKKQNTDTRCYGVALHIKTKWIWTIQSEQHWNLNFRFKSLSKLFTIAYRPDNTKTGFNSHETFPTIFLKTMHWLREAFNKKKHYFYEIFHKGGGSTPFP